MKTLNLMLAALALFVAPAHADTLFAQNAVGDKLYLYERPCANGKILALIDKVFMAECAEPPRDLKEGRAEIAGVGVFPVCWRVNLMDQAGVVYEDGSAAAVPMYMFKPLEGAI